MVRCLDGVSDCICGQHCTLNEPKYDQQLRAARLPESTDCILSVYVALVHPSLCHQSLARACGLDSAKNVTFIHSLMRARENVEALIDVFHRCHELLVFLEPSEGKCPSKVRS